MSRILQMTYESAYPWSSDRLSVYLRQSEQNTFASSFNLGAGYSRLVSIQELWIAICEAFTFTPEDELLAMWFLQQANSAWIAAIRVGLGGQPIDSRPLLRSTLEYSAYALHFTRHPEWKTVWFERHKDAASRETATKRFSTAQVARTFTADSPALARQYSRLYDIVVDSGGHPNELALRPRLKAADEAGVKVTQVGQLTDSPAAYIALSKLAADIGLMALTIFGRVFETRFRLALFDERLDRLRARRKSV